MIEQADRFALTTGPDGRVLLSLALRRHPRASADGFARAQRYWACAPGGAQPRWLAPAGDPGVPRPPGEQAGDPGAPRRPGEQAGDPGIPRRYGEHTGDPAIPRRYGEHAGDPSDPAVPRRPGEQADDAREAAEAHAAAAAYLPGVSCSGCGDRQWKPVDRGAVTRYVRTGVTGECLTCHQPPKAVPAPAPPPAPAPVPAVEVEARCLPSLTVRVDGAAAALLWTATGGDAHRMSSLVTELVSRNFGIRRPDLG